VWKSKFASVRGVFKAWDSMDVLLLKGTSEACKLLILTFRCSNIGYCELMNRLNPPVVLLQSSLISTPLPLRPTQSHTVSPNHFLNTIS